MISRRSILRAIPALLAAPAIVRASSLMAISQPRYYDLILTWMDFNEAFIQRYGALRSAIAESTTVREVQAIDIASGWPDPFATGRVLLAR